MRLGIKLFSIVVIIGGIACTADMSQDKSTFLPDSATWTVRLPGNAGIYNDGLIGLPVVDGAVLFHSTIFTSDREEDNRLYALDVETGSIKWTYPERYNPNDPCFFNGRPYIQNSTVVIKMPAYSPFANHDRILILDGKEGVRKKIIHLPPERSFSTTRDVVGSENNAWFVQEDKLSTLIYRLNILTGDTSVIKRFYPSHPGGRVEMSLRDLSLYSYNGEKMLLVGLSEHPPNETSARIVVLNALTGAEYFSKTVETDIDFPINVAVMNGSTIVYTSGRKAASFDVSTNRMNWQVNSGTVADSIMPGLLVQNNVVFLWGHKACKSLELETGNTLFKNSIECANVNGSSPWIVIVECDGRLSILDERTGSTRKVLQLPCANEERYGISYGCKPGFDGRGGIFLFGKYHGYYFAEVLNFNL